MRLVYAKSKVEKQCTSVKAAAKLFGGNAKLTEKLFSRINALEAAETLKDIKSQRQFHFHNLHDNGHRKLEGYFAIDVASRTDPWRIILQPLDEDEKPFNPCYIDEIASIVKVISITEVSKHYE